MDVTNPRRILAVSLEGQEEYLSRAIKELTGKAPVSSSLSLSGTTHDLALKTSYYSATVPIWLDLIASPSEWAESFLSDEAKEVLAVLGGLLLVFPIPGARPESLVGETDAPALIRNVGRVVREGLGGWEWDGVRLAVGIGEGDSDEWDEICGEVGMEFVQVKAGKEEKNEFGEKTGISRVLEALESNDWALDDPHIDDFGNFEDDDDDGDDNGGGFDPDSMDFVIERSDFEGLRQAIWETSLQMEDVSHQPNLDQTDFDPVDHSPKQDASELSSSNADSGETAAPEPKREPAGGDHEDRDLDEEDIAKVEKMMRKLQAARDSGEGMSDAARRRFAARAVEEVMREL